MRQSPISSFSRSGRAPASTSLKIPKPSVTVVIPTRNRIHLLRQTLQDVLDQDYENLDILVSDNGSVDGTRELIETMARENRRLRYRRNAERVPIISHFNQCLDAATGEYFVMVCDDDRINRSFVSSLAKGLTENGRASAAIPTNVIIDDSGNLIRTLPLPGKRTSSGIDFITQWLWKTSQLSVANLLTVMGRTEMMRNFRYQPFENGLNSDNLLFLQLALNGEVVFCQEAIFYWRHHDFQTGSSTPLRRINKAGKQFLNFVKSKEKFPHLRRLTAKEQRMIRRGIRQMNAEAQIYESGFYENPFDPRTLKNLFSIPPDSDLWRLALRLYIRHFRRTLKT
ncbi:MAG TPA: glycosyltransferase [Opitutales bacterium]|nr:glycosyltransferase [Opitutales bacterium]